MGRPSRVRRMLSTIWASAVSVLVTAATCGATSTRSWPQNGCTSGSGSSWKTSSSAPPRRPESRAPSRSSSTTCPPRATLMKKAPGGRWARKSAFTRPEVSGVRGSRFTRMSEPPRNSRSSSRPTKASHPAGGPRRRVRDQVRTRNPTARSISAAAPPISPVPITPAKTSPTSRSRSAARCPAHLPSRCAER